MHNDILSTLDTTIRIGTTDDIPFVLDAWVKSLRHIYPNQYALDFYPKAIDKCRILLDKSVSLVSHLSDDPNELISFIVYSSFRGSEVVHFAYTKLDARRQGKVKELLQFSNPQFTTTIFTHPAKNESVMKHFSSKYIYDPSILEIL